MKVSILGPGEYSLISKHTSMSEKDVNDFVNKFGRFLAENDFETSEFHSSLTSAYN